MHKFYVIMMFLLAAPLIANNGKQHGSGAGPSEEQQQKNSEFYCPKCNKETSKDNKVYCLVAAKAKKNTAARCGHWVCKTCSEKMQSGAFWTWSKKHSMPCPVCSEDVVGFVDVYGNAYPSQGATGYEAGL